MKVLARGLLVLVFTSGLALSTRVARAETVPSPSPTATVEDPSVFDVGGRIRASISEWFGDLVTSALGPVFDLMGRTVFSFLSLADNARVQDFRAEARGYRLPLILAHHHIAQTPSGGRRMTPQYPAQSGAQYPAQYPAQWRTGGFEMREMAGEAE